ncbi:hypothetical protein HanHA300_Chr04g0150191 [Helianthus annuus]|nr:hypothetical protein HanHA300_Chr04g0150191 [Helianthus annuus]KAJ0590450.1 hypothetical protein HanIR_Chr04g0197541 [Helianthus annuus]KAJ0598232.1 hypothetical protein HanHA89_Chr04g0163501 [Helianthus annuus]KAJ0758866.1 hypothetical protein HanLR1_Chr04g0155111 [Helianthus annuus]KAJ0762511.1 hypothetical protein HanOQP8_Chr04g0162151 [Helianthus annuus]
MARGPLLKKINGVPASPSGSKVLEKRFAKLRLSASENIKKKKKASLANKGNITLFDELADFAKTSASHSYVTEVPRPPLLLVVYEGVKEVADIMSHPDWPNHKLQSDLHQAEYMLMVTCRLFRDFLPTGWRYAREYASALIAGYGEVFTKDELEYIA